MKFFSKEEFRHIVIILAVLAIVSLPNFIVSIRRARDAQRKNDIGTIQNALLRFNDDFGFFPISTEDGRIAACNKAGEEIKENEQGYFNLEPCDWGKDVLTDPSDPSFPPYLSVIPIDPDNKKGVSYRYISNGKRFQILASLEGEDEDEYDNRIVSRGIKCGTKICNSGKASGRTPLDKSLEEYENELLEESK